MALIKETKLQKIKCPPNKCRKGGLWSNSNSNKVREMCRAWVMLPATVGVILAGLATPSHSACEVREPTDLNSPPQENDAGFYLTISGNPDHYEPGDLYTVSLRVSQIFSITRAMTLDIERHICNLWSAETRHIESLKHSVNGWEIDRYWDQRSS